MDRRARPPGGERLVLWDGPGDPPGQRKLYDIASPADTWKYVRGKVVAAGFTMLYGCPPITPTMPAVVEFFHGQQPIGRTRTFLVYDFRDIPDPP